MEKNQELKKTYALVGIMIVVYALEAVFSPRTMSLITCVVGVFLTFVVSHSTPRPVKIPAYLGLSSPFKYIIVDFLRSLLVSVVSIGLVCGAEYLFTMGTDSQLSAGDNIYFYGKEFSLNKCDVSVFILFIGLAVAASLIRTLFNELFFRGLILNINWDEKGSFTMANILQSVFTALYMTASPIIIVLSGMSRNPGIVTVGNIGVIFIALFYGFIIALRMGMLRYIGRSLWCCIFEHWMLDTFYLLYHFTGFFDPELSGFTGALRFVVIQLVAFVPTVISYMRVRKRDRKHSNDRRRTPAKHQ